MAITKKIVSYRVAGGPCQQGYQDTMTCDATVFTDAGVAVPGAVVVAAGDCPTEVVIVQPLVAQAATLDREFHIMCAPNGERVMVRDVSSTSSPAGTPPLLEFYTLAGAPWGGTPTSLVVCDADDDLIEISPLVGCLNGVEIQGVVMITDASPPVVLGEMWRSTAGVWGALPAGATAGKCAGVALPVADTEKYYSYVPHQVDESIVGTTYIRKQGAATSDTWLVQRVVENGTTTTITYAGVRNNPAITTPTAAWSSRSSLVYGDLNAA